jgi:hypothetical protein
VQLLIFAAIACAWARVGYKWIEAPGIALGVRLAWRLRADEHLRSDGAATASNAR